MTASEVTINNTFRFSSSIGWENTVKNISKCRSEKVAMGSFSDGAQVTLYLSKPKTIALAIGACTAGLALVALTVLIVVGLILFPPAAAALVMPILNATLLLSFGIRALVFGGLAIHKLCIGIDHKIPSTKV